MMSTKYRNKIDYLFVDNCLPKKERANFVTLIFQTYCYENLPLEKKNKKIQTISSISFLK